VVVIDNYYATDAWRRSLRDDGHFVVALDELGGIREADLIVNKDIGVTHHLYPNVPKENVLCGPSYFLLPHEAKSVTLSHNIPKFDADATGRSLSQKDFLSLMAQADIVSCSAGGTAYIALYMCKPVILRCVAENQRRTYEGFINKGYALPEETFGASLVLKQFPGLQVALIERGRALVPGHGVDLVMAAILERF